MRGGNCGCAGVCTCVSKREKFRLPVRCQARRGPGAVVVLCLSYLLGAPCYVTLAKDLGIQHEAVNHSRGQFVRRAKRGRKHIQCHTGTIDSVWVLLKRFIPKTLSSHSDKKCGSMVKHSTDDM